MKLKTIRILNFRCFEAVEIEIGSMHAFVGTNNAGKSTILKALDFMFNPSSKKINEESFCGGQTNLNIEIEAIFDQLTPDETTQLEPYLRSDGTFHFKRTASLIEDGEEGGADTTEGEDKIKIVPHYCKPQPKLAWLNTSNVNSKSIEAWWKEKDNLVHNGHSFAAFVGGKKPSVGDWKTKADEFAKAHLAESDCQATWTANPQGYANVLKATLPHFVLIPAVRDVSDESKVTKTGPFGKLIYEIVNNMDLPFRAELAAKLKETTRLLNREGKAERATGVTQVEETIKGFLAELMPADLELEFQAPTLEILLTTPRIFVSDGFRGAVEGKGHGLQRAVIFAILRAYAQLVTQKPDKGHRTLILGVEEPELYMHPTAQRTIRKVLRSIADGNDQVLFSTHSPLLVDVAYFDEIVRCENPSPKAADSRHGRGKRFQLLMSDMIVDFESRNPKLQGKASAASIRELYSNAYSASRNEGFFARIVILVEGPTELYSLPIYAMALGHDLDMKSISVIECGSKSQIDRLYRIFNELGIGCYILFDFDRDNSDPKRVTESRALLKLLDAADVEKPQQMEITPTFAYFVKEWEADLADEIPNYTTLVQTAKTSLGLREDNGKPLIARYIARELTGRQPPFIPKTLKNIIEKAIAVERTKSCLKKDVAQT